LSKLKGIRGLIFQLAILCLSFFYTPLLAQESYAERLIRDLSTVKEDTTKVFYLNELAWELKFDSPDSARLLLTQAYDLAEKLDYPKGQGDAMNFRGVTEDIHGNWKEAIEYFEKALEIRKQLTDLPGQASLYNNIGNVYESLEMYPESLKAYRLALKIRRDLGDEKKELRALYNLSITYESIGNYPEALETIFQFLERTGTEGDTTEIANAYNVVGNIMSELDRFEEALDYYLKARKLHSEVGNEYELAGAVQNIGYIYDALGEELIERDTFDKKEAQFLFNEAVKYYENSLSMTRRLEDEEGRAEVLNNLGTTYKNIGTFYREINDKKKANENWNIALDYSRQSERIRKNLEDKRGLLEVYNTIGDVLRRQRKYKEALRYAQLCLDFSREINDEKSEHNALKDLARAHYELGHYQKAYDFREEYDILRYRRMNEDQIKDNERRFALYTDNEKQFEIDKKKQELELQNERLARENIFRNSAIGGALALALLVFLLYNRNRIKNRANENLLQKNEIIEAEKQRAESLLLNILPAATAAELKEHGKARARSYKSVSVLFTDFKSFTQIAEQLSPEDLVAELDTCFQAFDEILTRHNIEKIKTIGDAYMCAGGLPIENETHPTDVVKAALEMRDFIKKFRIEQRATGKPEFSMRIGIHTGSVVAGVVGTKKFAYDIWGDAVNLAARMENSGEVGKVNISQQTYELVKDKFTCTHRGKISAKNKGEVDMYFVEN
jgi:class 3 adenylate cyclase/tetratricopeptide (TPR) repeat protein